MKPLRYKPPDRDPNAHLINAPHVKEAETLARMYGLTYLSITGYTALADLIKHVRTRCPIGPTSQDTIQRFPHA